jgi:hypothetical protein
MSMTPTRYYSRISKISRPCELKSRSMTDIWSIPLCGSVGRTKQILYLSGSDGRHFV